MKFINAIQRHSTLRFVTNRFKRPRYSTQRNGSFVNLLALHAVSQRNFSHLGAASRNSTQRFIMKFINASRYSDLLRTAPNRHASLCNATE